MRDLHSVAGAGPKVPEDGLRLELEEPDALDQQIRTVRREQKVAGIAVMLLDAAKILEPVVELLCDRALRWAALLATVGLTAYALRAPSWERLAIVATFAVLAPWIIRKGRL